MNDPVHKYTRLAMLLALATVIHTAESFVPVTVGWFKFGFANIVGLATLYLFGFKDALAVTFGRVFLGSLIGGLVGSPAFILALAGGMSAIFAMGLTYRLGGRAFSEVGVSVVGAVFHNVGQLMAAYIVLIRNEGILLLLPFMLIAATATGIINGLAAQFFIRHFRRVTEARPHPSIAG